MLNFFNQLLGVVGRILLSTKKTLIIFYRDMN
jgi:hypothetical protein